MCCARCAVCYAVLLYLQPLLEGNENLCICWEYRYIFYDSFGRGVYKSMHTYAELLEGAGFKVDKVSERGLRTKSARTRY